MLTAWSWSAAFHQSCSQACLFPPSHPNPLAPTQPMPPTHRVCRAGGGAPTPLLDVHRPSLIQCRPWMAVAPCDAGESHARRQLSIQPAAGKPTSGPSPTRRDAHASPLPLCRGSPWRSKYSLNRSRASTDLSSDTCSIETGWAAQIADPPPACRDSPLPARPHALCASRQRHARRQSAPSAYPMSTTTQHSC